MVSKKKNPLLYEDRIEKSVPQDHRLSSASLVMPIGDPRDGFFYPTLRLMIDSYNLIIFLGGLIPLDSVRLCWQPMTSLWLYDHTRTMLVVEDELAVIIKKHILIMMERHLLHHKYYSKNFLKRSLKKKTKIGFQDRLSLNAGQNYCRKLQGCILQYFRPSLTYHLSLRPLVCLFLSGCLRPVLLYLQHELVVFGCSHWLWHFLVNFLRILPRFVDMRQY